MKMDYNRSMLNFIKQYKWTLLASFFLPALLVGLGLWATGIYWGSARSILAGDAYHQYVALHSLYRNILHSGGTQGFLYTFTSGLGLNLYAFSAYYMGSFFMPLTFFFDVKNMPDALWLMTLLKFGAIGLSAFVSFKHIYKKLAPLMVLSVSTAFALMSFLTSQLEIIMWLDMFILLPLIIWGLHRLMEQGRRRLYFVTLLILFIQNYYFGFMVALFLVMYYLARATFGKWSWRVFFDFAISSSLAGLSSLIMLLPMFLDLRANNTSALSTVTRLFTDNAHPFDLLAKNFVGTYDTTQFEAIPMIYVGLFPLVLAVLFFFARSIRLRTRLAFLSRLMIFIASFYLNPLDLFWQGMHSPNMFLHRYAFLFSLLIVLMALESLSRWAEFKIWQISLAFGFLAAGFTATLLFGHYGYLAFVNIVLTGLFGLAYLILSVSAMKKWLPSHFFVIILAIFMIVEAGVNGFYQIQGLQKEWNFASRSYYDDQVSRLAPIAQKIQQLEGQNFARTENTMPDTANDGMKYGFNAISQFSSVRNSNASSVMRQLGFHTDDTYLNLRYPGNTLLMDAIFGVKYNINASQPQKYGFVSSKMPLTDLSVSQYSQNLGIFVPNGYKNASFSNSDQPKTLLSNQMKFVAALTDSTTPKPFFTPFYTTNEHTDDKITGIGNSVTLTRKTPSTASAVSVTYGITAPAQRQIYLAVPNISYINTNAETTLISVSNVDNPHLTRSLTNYSVATNDTGPFFNLGYFPESTKLRVTLAFPENSQVSFNMTSFWAFDNQLYAESMTSLQKHSPKAQLTKNGAKLSYDEQKAGDVFLTIPYDKGWTAQIDGKNIPISKAQNGFMKVAAPAGKHELHLQFFPQGLKVGSFCFILGIGLFVAYNYYKKTY